MSQTRRQIFDKIYSEKKHPYGHKPLQEVQEVAKLLPQKSRVLDLGCGDGRNSIFLAKQNFEVDSVDISPVAIEILKNSAKEKDLKIQTFIEKIENFQTQKKYDLIICSYVLQTLTKNSIPEFFLKIQSLTKRRGMNFLTVFSEKSSFSEKESLTFLPKSLPDLEIFYLDWTIKKSFSKKIFTRTDLHKKSTVFTLLAQKN